MLLAIERRHVSKSVYELRPLSPLAANAWNKMLTVIAYHDAGMSSVTVIGEVDYNIARQCRLYVNFLVPIVFDKRLHELRFMYARATASED